MRDNLITDAYGQIRTEKIVRSVLINVVGNTLIAVILTAIGFGDDFVSTFIFSQCIGTSILLANFSVIPLFTRFTRPAAQLLIVVAAVTAGAVAGTLLGAAVNGVSPLRFLREHSAFFGQIVLIGLLFGAIISYVFISLGVISEERMKRLETEKTAVETELKALQSQMEPHFLFNTLSNVLSLIETDRDRARGMLEAFTLFLRSSFLSARQRTVPLSQELEVVRSYLAVVAIRMGGRLRSRIDVPDEAGRVPIPPLLIQPLVENAVKHGLEPSPEGGAVTVAAERDGGLVRITVADTGVGMEETAPGGGAGIGLENLRKRLDLLFGGKARMLIEENRPRGIKVTIEVPDESDTGDHR